jgi:hypothetical protein
LNLPCAMLAECYWIAGCCVVGLKKWDDDDDRDPGQNLASSHSGLSIYIYIFFLVIFTFLKISYNSNHSNHVFIMECINAQ